MPFDEDRYVGEGSESVGFDLCTELDLVGGFFSI